MPVKKLDVTMLSHTDSNAKALKAYKQFVDGCELTSEQDARLHGRELRRGIKKLHATAFE